MISEKKKRLLQSITALMCVVTIASCDLLVYATPTTAELEQKTTNLQNELNSLNSELDTLCQELEDTSIKIETLAVQIEKAKLDLAAAQLNEDAQYDAMKERIKFMYEGGSLSLLHILFTSEDMGDFLNKAEYVSTISDYDRQMLEEFKKVRLDVEEKQTALKEQQTELAALQETLTAKQNALTSKISSTSGELANYSAQLERALAAANASQQAQNNNTSGSIGNTGNTNNPNGGSATTTVPAVPANTSDVALLAGILQCEAGNSYAGMIAVGTVIMNRVASPRFPNTIYDVVYQKNQFSPAGSGWLARVLAQGPNASAYAAAKDVLGGTRHAAVINCLFFNAAWTGRQGINVGGNVFW